MCTAPVLRRNTLSYRWWSLLPWVSRNAATRRKTRRKTVVDDANMNFKNIWELTSGPGNRQTSEHANSHPRHVLPRRMTMRSFGIARSRFTRHDDHQTSDPTVCRGVTSSSSSATLYRDPPAHSLRFNKRHLYNQTANVAFRNSRLSCSIMRRSFVLFSLLPVLAGAFAPSSPLTSRQVRPSEAPPEALGIASLCTCKRM